MSTTTVRRDKGTGSVAFDRTSGFWVGRLEVGKDLAGRRIRVKVIGASRSEARTKLDELRKKREAGIDVGARTTTFAELTDAWLERGLPADLSENTVWNYGRILRGHVLPTLGAKRVAELRSDDIDAMLDVMANRGPAASSMRHALNLTRRVLRFGMRRDLVVRNVAEPVQTRRGPKAERYGLTVKQAKKLLRAPPTTGSPD